MLRIGIVAGEASGDYLGADLINAIRNKIPNVVFEGIGGPQMEKQKCHLIFPMEKLSVMGLVEVMSSYMELVGIRNKITEHFLQQPPDVFIGIDAPDFNLELERRLHANGIKTVHYVSPQVWAWRTYRVIKIARAVDVILALFPFEKEFYENHNIPVAYVGHPLADRINVSPDKSAARIRLGLPKDKKIIALMPGSRKMELNSLLSPFLLTADWCMQRRSDIHFISSLLNNNSIQAFNDARSKLSLDNLPLSLYKNRSHDVLEAADVVLLASGTITLEAMLYKKPMVVAYKINWITYYLIKSMVKVKFAALPNLLAGKEIVPECLQNKCRPEILGENIMKWLEDEIAVSALEKEFMGLHNLLRKNAGQVAANRVLQLLNLESAVDRF